MSLVKTGAGLYLRAPEGGVEDVQRMKDAGFDYICVNTHDFSIDAWGVVVARAGAVGMSCGAWKFVRSDEDVNALKDEAKKLGGPMIVNAEKPLDHGEVSIGAITDACREMDAAISTEPQLFASVDWSRVADIPIQIQVFPQENSLSRDPRGCRANAFAMGPRFVHFMLGMHALASESFPHRRQPYTGLHRRRLRERLRAVGASAAHRPHGDRLPHEGAGVRTGLPEREAAIAAVARLALAQACHAQRGLRDLHRPRRFLRGSARHGDGANARSVWDPDHRRLRPRLLRRHPHAGLGDSRADLRRRFAGV